MCLRKPKKQEALHNVDRCAGIFEYKIMDKNIRLKVKHTLPLREHMEAVRAILDLVFMDATSSASGCEEYHPEFYNLAMTHALLLYYSDLDLQTVFGETQNNESKLSTEDGVWYMRKNTSVVEDILRYSADAAEVVQEAVTAISHKARMLENNNGALESLFKRLDGILDTVGDVNAEDLESLLGLAKTFTGTNAAEELVSAVLKTQAKAKKIK